eukprot:TRINITY_DN5086_c0_g2_i1.p1 TRINITY_DN5086_c0_g2~~TRINITY_DN5086_c0_g2_i1.p1  ORF type:complete len:486 (+),score=93.35 TRINITY_DN5086_c0_g2_i1:24-1481(+)
MMRALSLLLLILGVALLVGAQQIQNLPGYNGSTPITQYSGYVTVDESHGRALFYWLIQSLSSSPSDDPLVVWFQGGPGCSSLYGLFVEHGPFRPNIQGGLDFNPLTWANVANMLYVEAPAGVGFSYSNTTSDYNTNDTQTATDNYNFLLGFLQEYPEYQGRDIWIAGESYGGVYVPSLSQRIITGENEQLSNALQGFMIGNPVFRCGDDTIQAQFNLYYWHGLVSYTNYLNWTNHGCNGDWYKVTCLEIYNTTLSEIGIFDQEVVVSTGPPSLPLPSLDPDDLYQDFCTGNGSLSFSIEVPSIEEDCTSIDTLLQNYLNQADVQVAIHARPTDWTACTNNINYTRNYVSMLPFYFDFFKERPDLNILVYSGDVDIATVPFAITQKCLNELGRKTTQNWQPWYVNGATAGYWEVHEGFTYATVKGAGHEAPAYETWNSYNLFTRFLATQSLNDPSLAAQKKLGLRRTRHLRQGHILRSDPVDNTSI